MGKTAVVSGKETKPRLHPMEALLKRLPFLFMESVRFQKGDPRDFTSKH